ncbi:MAG: CSLREA domain-containing protein [Planctomycetes bacterium]|nr:CSLREA domain-containing protein [Planctomycetota bacterium]
MFPLSWLRPLKSRPSTSRKRPPRRRTIPRIEALEDRALLATIVVTSTADTVDDTDSVTTLREAIQQANAQVNVDADNDGTPEPDRIEFAIPTTDAGYDPDTGAFTIQPQTSLSAITDPVIIDGYTQAGASPNTLADGIDAVLKVVVNGANAVGNHWDPNGDANGLLLFTTTTVRGLVINGFSRMGIELRGGGSSIIEGNFIGTDVTGAFAAPNNIHGIAIIDGSPNNLIGGRTPAARNLISGNSQNGVAITGAGAANNRVEGNFVGTDVTGEKALGNGADGIGFGAGAPNTIIGGAAPGAGNLVSGNGREGINAGGIEGGIVQGNFVGTDVTGTKALGNLRHGIFGGNSLIGGTDPGAGNLISGNGGPGIGGGGFTVQGNLFGTDVTGTTSIGADGRPLYNGPGAGQTAAGLDFAGALHAPTLIGGTDPAARNSFAGSVTIYFGTGGRVQGNDIGGILRIGAATDILIGGSEPGAGNVIREGIQLFQTVGARVQGNMIGTDATGLSRTGSGTIEIWGGAHGNVIGADGDGIHDGAEGNVLGSIRITGVGTDDNVVAGNFIGTDITGSTALGVGGWVVTENGASGNRIGANGDGVSDALERNVIAGFLQSFSPTGAAVAIRDGNDNTVAGNFIGTDATGQNALGNTSHGVLVHAFTSSAQSNVVGTVGVGVADDVEGNVIAFKGLDGFAAIVVTEANAFRGNSIYSNAGLGIDLGNDGVTPQDAGDADTGANNLQNFPVLDSASGGATTRVTGTLNSLATTSFIIDFYANEELDPSGHGEGERWLGFATVTTDAGGDASFYATDLAAAASGEYVTATATRLEDHDNDPATPLVATDTSEFSATAPVVNEPPVADAGGPYLVVRGGTVRLDASASSDPEQSAETLTYEWDFDGDGVFDDATGVNPVFSAAGIETPGTRTVALRVTDDGGLTDTATGTIEIVVIALIDDDCHPGQTALAVGGTLGGDQITFTPGSNAGEVEVTLNGVSLGVFEPTGRLIAYGQGGDDDIQVSGSITLAAWLYGDGGNDRLKGGAGHDVLIGSAGDDLLVGGQGRDLLVGGHGADRIVGNADHDVLIAGVLQFDRLEHALCRIMAEWTSGRDYQTRIENLSGEGTGERLNDETFLKIGGTVLDDEGESEDVLTGSAGDDWFFFWAPEDRATDLKDEVFADDLDWILAEG